MRYFFCIQTGFQRPHSRVSTWPYCTAKTIFFTSIFHPRFKYVYISNFTNRSKLALIHSVCKPTQNSGASQITSRNQVFSVHIYLFQRRSLVWDTSFDTNNQEVTSLKPFAYLNSSAESDHYICNVLNSVLNVIVPVCFSIYLIDNKLISSHHLWFS